MAARGARTQDGGRRHALRRGLSGLVTVALLGGGMVSLTAGATAAVPAVVPTATTGTVTSAPVVSATPTGQGAACTAADTRATNRWWIFGTTLKMDFAASGTPAPVFGSMSQGMSAEGSAVITDTQGNMRFWANGVGVWGADGNPIKNSEGGLGMLSSNQTVVAMPALGAPGKYYVVTSGYQAEMGTDKATLYYSVIDMNANGGKGEMTQKNIVLGSPGVAGEGLSATVNATGDGFWVYSVASNSNKIHRWEFKADGPTSIAGQAQTMSDTFAWYSSIHFDNSRGSNQGVVLASNLNIYTMVTVNRSTGALTEGKRVSHVPLAGGGMLYGATFSPTGRYMYFTEIYGSPSHVYRVDTQTATATDMLASRRDMGALADQHNSGGAIKLGPDGNIWAIDGALIASLVKITNPESVSPTMQRLDLSPYHVYTGWGLPDMVTGCEKPVPQLTATVSAPTGLTLGDAITPVTVTVKNTGNTALSEIAAATGASTVFPKTVLAPGETMTGTAPAGTWGSVTQAQNDAGLIQGITHTISARGSIGVDPVTDQPRTAVITVSPTMDLPVVVTRTLTLDPTQGSLGSAPATVKRVDGQPWGALPEPSSTGKVFLGWHTAVTEGTQVLSTTTATKDLTAYGQWRPAKFNVVFYPNAEMGTVTGSTPSASFDSGCTDCLLTANGFTKTTGAPELITSEGEVAEVNSTFLGWSLDPASRTGDIADRAVAGALSQTDGDTVSLYAVWDDAPQFVVTAYPDRLFTLTQAIGGAVTEEALLSTVRATDRETKPLVTKTSNEVAEADDSDVGITLHDYDASDFTSMTDTGVVSLTYKVKDELGHVAFLRIHVTIADEAPLPSASQEYLRGISPEFAAQGPENGGFPAESLWLTDPTRKAALGAALSGDSAVTYCLDADAVSVLRDQAVAGLGGSKVPDGLASAAAVMREQGTCS